MYAIIAVKINIYDRYDNRLENNPRPKKSTSNR